MPWFILFFLCLTMCPANAQESFIFQLEDADIVASKVLRGDGDTYGLGDWQCHFDVSLADTALLLEGRIVFSEKSNDQTTILGTYKKLIQVETLARCRHCIIQIDPMQGTVSGPNIGARGYRWFPGKGLIRRAKIQTDVFGEDAGNIGGTIRFAPIKVLVDCSITMDGRR